MIIDAKGMIVGRLASFAAKKALLGEEVILINSGEAVISGNSKKILGYNLNRRKRGTFKGPFISRKPDMYLKRAVRGMLPYKKERGREAFRRIRCYEGSPGLKEKPITLKDADCKKLLNSRSMKVKDICRLIGGK